MSVEINKLLDLVIKQGGSDLHLAVGKPPCIRIDGELRNINVPPLTPENTAMLMKSITSERKQQELSEEGGADFALSFSESARFRVSVFKQRGSIGLVLRQIPSKLLSFEQIGLPDYIKDYLQKEKGLFLVTGPTGSGKSTTLATMIDHINTNFNKHIITVEDPIEFQHPHKKAVVTQREIGVDVPSFSEALRRALRQDPDVILVGEMRDLETISAAISAAETGHLVFGTLHTIGAAKTMDRIIDAFPTNQQSQIRVQLSTVLLGVLSQTLVPAAEGKGRVAGFEIMFTNPAIANLVRENKTFKIPSIIQTSAKDGMTLLDDNLFRLYTEGRVKLDDVVHKVQDFDMFQNKIKSLMEQRQMKKR